MDAWKGSCMRGEEMREDQRRGRVVESVAGKEGGWEGAWPRVRVSEKDRKEIIQTTTEVSVYRVTYRYNINMEQHSHQVVASQPGHEKVA